MTAGQGELALARKRIFANAQDVLRDEVAQRTGLTFPLPRLPNGACDTQEQVAALLRPLCDQLGRFPTCAEMVAALPHHVHNTVVTKWGVHAMAATMGVPHTGYRRWSRELALAEFVRCLPRRRDLHAAARPGALAQQDAGAPVYRGSGGRRRQLLRRPRGGLGDHAG